MSECARLNNKRQSERIMKLPTLFEKPVKHIGLRTLFKGLDTTILESQGPLPIPTLDNQTVSAEAILTLRKTNNILLRGASVKETPCKKRPGFFANKNIESDSDVVAHCQGNSAGISTTYLFPVARKFAIRAGVSAVYILSGDLVPEDDWVYVPEFMEGRMYDNNYEGETVLRYSVPEETLIAKRKIFNGFITYDPLEVNGLLVDHTLLKQNKKLHKQFYRDVYYPFSREIGPLIKSKKVTATELNEYNNCRLKFHLEYRYKQRMLSSEHIDTKKADETDLKVFNALFNK